MNPKMILLRKRVVLLPLFFVRIHKLCTIYNVRKMSKWKSVCGRRKLLHLKYAEREIEQKSKVINVLKLLI